MEFVPFGQDGIPPSAGKALKCRVLYNSLESVYKKGIEAFNLLKTLTILTLLTTLTNDNTFKLYQ
jgi:hypothetical protein